MKLPENKYGIIDVSDDTFSLEELQRIIDGPIAAIEANYQKALKEQVFVVSLTESL